MTLAFPEFRTPGPEATAVQPRACTWLPPRRGLYRNVFKRVLDVTAIALAAPVVVPVVAALAVMVARDGGNPFYSQLRVGKNGRRFRMWKLRSMVNDADARMEEYLDAHPEARAEWNLTQKLKDDPRITPLGKIIRQTSLDELPQLWNVLKGEMSMVGPRPERPVFIEQLEQQVPYFKQRLYVKPGVTGHAQVRCEYGASAEDMLQKLEYDLYYIKSYSVLFDLSVMLDTVKVVLFRIGAR